MSASPPLDVQYYTNVRSDIAPVLPGRLGRTLEVGCSSGLTLKWLKEQHGATETVGVEINPELRQALEANADRAIIGPAEADLSELGLFDTILFLDVLEHLTDPWAVLARYTALLNPGGCIIICIPNIAHFQIIRDLILGRGFQYADYGILDRTHVRFFVRETLIRLVEGAGLTIEQEVKIIGPSISRLARLLHAIGGGKLNDLLTVQYIVRARRPPCQAREVSAKWVRYGAHC